MILTELFDKTVPFHLVGRTADFEVNGKTYLVGFSKSKLRPNGVNFSFVLARDGNVDHNYKSEISGTGDEIIVFSTVLKVLAEYIARNDPTSVQFTASRDEPSRIKLYDRMMRMFTKDWDINYMGDPHDKIYTLTKKQQPGVQYDPQRAV